MSVFYVCTCISKFCGCLYVRGVCDITVGFWYVCVCACLSVCSILRHTYLYLYLYTYTHNVYTPQRPTVVYGLLVFPDTL